jgi:hypothetical protein
MTEIRSSTITIRIDPVLRAALDEVAEARGWSASTAMLAAIREAVKVKIPTVPRHWGKTESLTFRIPAALESEFVAWCDAQIWTRTVGSASAITMMIDAQKPQASKKDSRTKRAA